LGVHDVAAVLGDRVDQRPRIAGIVGARYDDPGRRAGQVEIPSIGVGSTTSYGRSASRRRRRWRPRNRHAEEQDPGHGVATATATATELGVLGHPAPDRVQRLDQVPVPVEHLSVRQHLEEDALPVPDREPAGGEIGLSTV
jgi:hypothetical protein